MCSFWRMAFASTYIQSCDEEAIQVQQQLCAGTSPNFLRFKSTTFSLVCENPLRVEYWHILNEFEDITGGTKPPISLATMLVAILLQYVPEGLESYMSVRSWRRLTSSLGQADRRGQRKRKAKKFLCSRLPPGMMLSVQTMHMCRFARKSPSFKVMVFYILPVFPPQLVGLFYKRPQRGTNSVWRTLLNKTVRLGRVFVPHEW